MLLQGYAMSMPCPVGDIPMKPGPNLMSTDTPATSRRYTRRWGLIALLAVLLVPALLFGAWSWITLNYSYSKGEHAGYV